MLIFHSSNPLFLRGGSAFLKIGLRGDRRFWFLKGDTQKGGSKIKGGFRPLSKTESFLHLRESIGHEKSELRRGISRLFQGEIQKRGIRTLFELREHAPSGFLCI